MSEELRSADGVPCPALLPVAKGPAAISVAPFVRLQRRYGRNAPPGSS